MKRAIVRIINNAGLARVLEGTLGMELPVKTFTVGLVGPVAHVIDARYYDVDRDVQVWSIARDGYEVVYDDGSFAKCEVAFAEKGGDHEG